MKSLTKADDCLLPHEPDHIIATKHRGETAVSNLAWMCFICNRAKGSDIASIDPQTGEVVRLFSPRRDSWPEHFSIEDDGVIRALTDVLARSLRSPTSGFSCSSCRLLIHAEQEYYRLN